MIQYFLKLIVLLSATLLITHCGDKENILSQGIELIKTIETQSPLQTLEGTPKNLPPPEEKPIAETISTNNNSSLDEYEDEDQDECEDENEKILKKSKEASLIYSSDRDQNDNSNRSQNLLCHVPQGHPESQTTHSFKNIKAVEAHLRNHQFDYLGPCQ